MNTILLDMHMNMHMNMNMNMCMCMLCTLWYFWVPSRALILLRGKVEKSTNCCGPAVVCGKVCGWVYYCRGCWVWVGGFYLGRTARRRAAPRRPQSSGLAACTWRGQARGVCGGLCVLCMGSLEGGRVTVGSGHRRDNANDREKYTVR
jgi:hypothetical protein